jgi:hypothetical protein
MLCPDGACVGVIGPTGTCKVCGRAAPGWGDERNRGLQDSDPDGEPEMTPLPAPEPTDHLDDVAPPRREGWTERRLCENGACIGVIGSDGHCKVCGTLDAGGPEVVQSDDDDELAADDEAGSSVDDDDDDAEDDDEDDEDSDEDEERTLCPDGACVGVIGADGRCKVCGREAQA